MRNPSKTAVIISPASYTNGATATGNVDTLGFDRAKIAVSMSTSNTVSNNPSTFNLLESDDTTATNFATVSGYVGDTDWTIPNAVTAGNWAVQLNVDLRGRKRYLRLAVTPLTTQVIAATAELTAGDEAPVAAVGDMKAIVKG